MNRWGVVAWLVAVTLIAASAAAGAADVGGRPWDEENKPGQGPQAFVEEMRRERATVMPWERIRVRGREFGDSDLPPVIKEGRVLIPVRAVTRALGAYVTWDPDDNTVVIVRGDITIEFTIGDSFFLVNGVEQQFDVPAQILCNRTFVPLRFIAAALGERANYDSVTGFVSIGDEEEEEEGDEGSSHPGQGRGVRGL